MSARKDLFDGRDLAVVLYLLLNRTTFAEAKSAVAGKDLQPVRKDPWPKRWSDPTYLGDGPWGA